MINTLSDLRARLAGGGLEKSDLIALLYSANIPVGFKVAAFPMIMALPAEAMEKIPGELSPLLDQLEAGDLTGLRDRLNGAGVPPAWIDKILEYASNLH